MEYRKPLFFILFILFIAGCVYLYFLTAPATPIPSSIPTATTQKTVNPSNSTSGQSMQSVLLPNQAKTPDEFTKDFYAWYLQGHIASWKFDGTDQFKSQIGNWLTPDFIQKWGTIVTNTNSDPVLLAQDYQNSWVTDMQTTIVTETATSSVITLILGKTPDLVMVLTVSLVSHDNSWRINSITKGQ